MIKRVKRAVNTEMAKIKIILQSDLCAGSGKSFGNVVDTDFAMDRYGMPFISGRSIKGCLRQAAEMLIQTGAAQGIDREIVRRLFGDGQGAEGAFSVGDAEPECADAFRSILQAEVLDNQLLQLVRDKARPGIVADMFGSVRGQTAMEDGVAKEGSLRYTRVLNRFSPIDEEQLTLVADVTLYDPELEEALKLCCRAVRHIGMHRNRGLGMVRLIYEAENAPQAEAVPADLLDSGETIEYRIVLDANMVLSGVTEQLSYIPGRSVLGCMAGAYLSQNREIGDPNDDPTFRALFLSGDVCWSDLTPVIDGKRSEPTPLMLYLLKNDNRYVNAFTENGKREIQSKKNKTTEGTWAIVTGDGYRIADVQSEVSYHHRHAGDGQEAMLYSHTSLASHMVYGGTVTAPERYKDQVLHLLRTAKLRFGHSKNARYAACRLLGSPTYGEAYEKKQVKAGEKIYAVLGSDLLLTGADGLYLTDPKELRTVLCERIGLGDDDTADDRVRFRTVGGYQAKWQLQKQQLPVVCGGSVFCFRAESDGELFTPRRLGELTQEGFGIVHLLKESEKNLHVHLEKAGVQTNAVRSAVDLSDREAFAKAFLRHLAERTLPASAEKVYKGLKNEAKLNELNNGRVRLMIEESESLADLRKRIEQIKREAPKKAAKAFIDNVYPEGDDSIKRLLCGDENVQKIAGETDEDFKKFFEKNWKRLPLDVLHLLYYDRNQNEGKPEGTER